MGGSWRILVADQEDAAAQMALDEQLAARGWPTMRLFRWEKPALSLGYRQPPLEWVRPEVLRDHGIELVERPTGGGLAVHGSDLSCSVVIPEFPQRSLRRLMTMVCESLAQGLRTFGVPIQWRDDVGQFSSIEYCLAQESPFALMDGRRKLGGFAIRRYPHTWLIQGSILIRPFLGVFEQVMPREVHEAFQAQARSFEEAVGGPISDQELIARLIKAWRTTWEIPCVWTTTQWLSGHVAR